ncbi:serine hydroxymethyltransferase [Patescibacteria group bacterium]|nr:serine hydroxymethyltransferase [Patescibacteria group bacterium]
MSNYLRRTDSEIAELILGEENRQQDSLIMIPSENYTSLAVREALGSVLTDKYSEGYPGKRYYQGNEMVDQIEKLAIARAKKLFEVAHVNVQPHSGCEANLAILTALCRINDPILSQHLYMGGHLSMGQEASITSKIYQPHYYGLTKDGDINWLELESQAKKYRPKIIFCGGTGFTKVFNFSRFAKIADKINAYFIADVSHIGGLIVGGAHPSPKNYAHVIMTTTHKTLRGPRGAMIMITKKGLKKDPDLPAKIDKAVFPGLQGGPHNNNITALAVALNEASIPSFQRYSKQTVENSQVLAAKLIKYDFKLIGGGSQNHMIWIDLNNKRVDGWTMAWACEAAGIICNRQTIPFDKKSPYYPSGLRLGTPALTTRGMKEKEMVLIAGWLNEIIERLKNIDLKDIGSHDKEKDQQARKIFKQQIFKDKRLLDIKKQVRELCHRFPVNSIN